MHKLIGSWLQLIFLCNLASIALLSSANLNGRATPLCPPAQSAEFDHQLR
jgi:hypothetical protein